MRENLTDIEILNFYIEAGVDETIAEEPTNWLEYVEPAKPVAAPQKRKSAPVRSTSPVAAATTPSTPSINISEQVEQAKKSAKEAKSLEELKSAVNNFDGISFKKMATSTVFGLGNPDAPLMIIDRAPSSDEDRSGEPFAGDVRILLGKMMAAIGLQLEETYLASSFPWRPPGGRALTLEEQAMCLPFVHRHIELAEPKILLLMGEASSFVQNRSEGVNKLRGKWDELEVNGTSFKAITTFHPKFLMDHPASKRLAWQDLLALKAALDDHT